VVLFLSNVVLQRCHGLKQGINKLSDRWSLLTPTLPPEEGKRRKRERDLQIEYNNFTNNTDTSNNMNNKRNKAKYRKPQNHRMFGVGRDLCGSSSPTPDSEFTRVGCQALVSRQQLPGSTRQSQTGLGSRQELDSGMHGSESGSESQVEQQAGSSSAGSRGQRGRDPPDPPALN